MKEIPLTSGKFAKVDDEDYEYLMQWKWHIKKGYAKRQEQGSKKEISMHRFIMNTPVGLETDHKDGDKLNNQKSNLRYATTSQNQANKKLQTNNISGYKGVYRRKDRRQWRARVYKDGVEVFNKGFYSALDAAKAYDAEAIRVFGEFARINFPAPEEAAQEK